MFDSLQLLCPVIMPICSTSIVINIDSIQTSILL